MTACILSEAAKREKNYNRMGQGKAPKTLTFIDGEQPHLCIEIPRTPDTEQDYINCQSYTWGLFKYVLLVVPLFYNEKPCWVHCPLRSLGKKIVLNF